MSLTISNTTFEFHENIIVKREDLCCPDPGPSFSKVRGVERKLWGLYKQKNKPKYIGVVDTLHSKAGWGVSYICKSIGFKCMVFYPHYKSEEKDFVRGYQQKCLEFGSTIIPIEATKSAILFHYANKILKEKTNGDCFMMPNGLKLQETIDETTIEVINNTPKEYLNHDWVISVSSGTIASGVISGLFHLGFSRKIYIHMGYSRSKDTLFRYLTKGIFGGYNFQIEIIDEHYDYSDFVKYPCPFPCNPYYDLKAWKWINENRKNLTLPVVFWNIGA